MLIPLGQAASATRQPNPWRLLGGYALACASELALHSRRADEAKVMLMVAGSLIAPLVLAVELLWVLTGRGRRARRLLGTDSIIVSPRGRGAASGSRPSRPRATAGP